MITDFQYAQEFGSDYMLMPCKFDSGGGVETIDFGSQLSTERTNVVGTDERVLINPAYSSTPTFTFQACKVDSYGNPLPVSAEEYSKINRWLNRKESHKFKVKEDTYENIYYWGSFNIQAVKINGVIYGIELTFTSDYPYGFMDENTVEYSNVNNFTIYNCSDETGDIYPNIEITCLSDGDLKITNTMDNEIFEIKNCTKNEVIKIDSKNRVIMSSADTHNLCNDFNYNYLKIISTYENRLNIYSSTLNINITVKYSPVRKVGV